MQRRKGDKERDRNLNEKREGRERRAREERGAKRKRGETVISD